MLFGKLFLWLSPFKHCTWILDCSILKAKIQCSALCKCVGCKNCDEATKALLQLVNAADMRKQQQLQQHKYNSQLNANQHAHAEQASQQNSLYAHNNSGGTRHSASWRTNTFSSTGKLDLFNNADFSFARSNQEQIKLEQLNLKYVFSFVYTDSIKFEG